MREQDEAPPLVRAHREKLSGRYTVGRVDGGAVAVGLVVALVTFVPTMPTIVPAWIAVPVVGGGLVLGGILAARTRASETVCGACHGALTAVAFLAVIALLLGATALSGGDPTALPLAAIVGLDRLPVLTAVAAAVGAGTLGGSLTMATRTDP